MSAGIVFDLIGNDKSASKALGDVKDGAKKAAAGIAAAFGAAAIGDAIQGAFDTESTLAKFKATLGATPRVAKEAGDLAGRLYRDGMGASLEEVTLAIGGIGTNMEDLSLYFGENAKYSAGELGGITEQALDLATALGVDVVDVTRAAGQMMRNGIAPDAAFAFDVLATGAMNGANASGDLLETFTEYSPTFERIGVSSSDALAMMKSGLEAGIMDTDRAAVAFEDMLDLVTAGGKPAVEALDSLGLGADDMANKLLAGGPAAQEATGQIMTALRNLTDPQAQQTAGVALFGETWITSGGKAVLAMDPVLNKTNDIEDSTKILGDTLNITAQHKVDRMKRSFDGWVESMVETEGTMGDVAAVAVGLGPQIVSFAGSVGMIVVGLKAVGVGAAGAIVTATIPLWPLLAAITAIGVVVKTVMDNIGRMSQQASALARGDFTTASSLRSPAATFGVGSWASPVSSYSAAGIASAGRYNPMGSNINPGRTYKLASGGVVMPRPGGTNAVIGEAGEAEAVVPLSKLAGMMGGTTGGGVTIQVQGIIAGTADEFAQKVTELLEAARRRGTIA